MTDFANLELFWRGIGDEAIYRSLGFEQGFALRDPATATRPAATQLQNGTQLMVWRGQDNDDSLYWSTDTDFETGNGEPGWGEGPGGTSWAPSLTAWKQGATMAWIGVGNDERIWTSHYGMGDGNPWSPQAVAILPNDEPITSASSPAIASDPNGNLMMVWRGPGNDDSLYSATSTDGKTFTNFQQIPWAGSTIQPALAYYANSFILAFKGSQGDNGIYSAQTLNGGWTNVFNAGQKGTSHGPCLVVCDDNLVMAWKGVPGDNDLYYAFNPAGDAATWSDQSVIEYSGSSVGPTGFFYHAP